MVISLLRRRGEVLAGLDIEDRRHPRIRRARGAEEEGRGEKGEVLGEKR